MATLQSKCSDVYWEWETSFPCGKFLNESCDVMMDVCDDTFSDSSLYMRLQRV